MDILTASQSSNDSTQTPPASVPAAPPPLPPDPLPTPMISTPALKTVEQIVPERHETPPALPIPTPIEEPSSIPVWSTAPKPTIPSVDTLISPQTPTPSILSTTQIPPIITPAEMKTPVIPPANATPAPNLDSLLNSPMTNWNPSKKPDELKAKIPPVSSSPTASLPPKKSGKGKVAALVAMLLLVITIPIAIFFISKTNSQLTDSRSRAANLCGGYANPGETHCNIDDCHQYFCNGDGSWTDKGSGGVCSRQSKCNGNNGGGGGGNNTGPGCHTTCANGRKFDDANPYTFATCGDWAIEACRTVGSTPSSTTGSIPKSTGGGIPGSCAAALQSCESKSCCSGQNLVCQGASGNRVCQQSSSENQCPGGGSCTGIIAFNCNSLTNGQCLSNSKDFSDWGSAVSYAGSCGQVDKVCIGGTKNRQLCGDFTVFNQCSGGGTPPANTNTPTPTIAGQCQNIKIYQNGQIINPATLKPSDTIVIAATGTNATKARIRVNGGLFSETTTKNTAGEYTLNFTIPSSGITTFTVEAELFIGATWR